MIAEYFAANLDYILFLHGLGFLLLAVSAYVVQKNDQGFPLTMAWLIAFALVRCLYIWLDMIAVNCETSSCLDNIRLLCHLLSFLCLCEFGRTNLARQGLRLGRWVLLALLLPALVSAIFKPFAAHSIIRYTLGLVGGIAAAAAFCRAAPPPHPRQTLLCFYGAGMLFYALTAGLIAPKSPFFPASIVNQELFSQITGLPIQTIRCVFILCLAAAMWRYLRRHYLPNFSFLRPIHRAILTFVHIALVVIIVLGGLLTHHLGESAAAAIRQEHLGQHQLITAHLAETIGYIEGYCAFLAGNPMVVAALEKGGEAAIAAANVELDRCREVLGDGVCYLLDRRGMTVASSNRGDPDSFVGHNYAFRPYFQEALAGNVGRYFALGVTSQQRGFYAARAVRNAGGEIVGVAAIKIGVALLERHLASPMPFGMASPQGVIFLANLPHLRMRCLEPLSPGQRQELLTTRQFGDGPFIPLFASPPLPDAPIDYEGRKMRFFQTEGPLPGWRIFHLEASSWRVAAYRLSAIGATLALVVLLLSGYFVWQVLIKATTEIALSEERYRMLVEDQTEFICRLSPDGRVLFANETLCRYLGLARSEVAGALFLPGLTAAERDMLVAAYGKLSLAHPIATQEAQFTLPSGQRRWQQWVFRGLIKDGAIWEIHAVGRDISERKAAEEALIRSERLAAIGTLATGVAHHYNNLNMGVLGYTELALNHPELPSQVESYLHNIRQSALRIRDITNNLLTISRPAEALGKAENLNDIVERALSLFTALFQEEKIDLACRLGEIPPVVLESGQIQQCVTHLLTNAYHALLDRAEKRIEIETRCEGEDIVLSIADTGCGIPPERMPHIFTPFYSTKGEHASRGSPMARVRGVGLGLSITQAIIKKHGGSIAVQSEADRGTVVTIRLPVRVD